MVDGPQHAVGRRPPDQGPAGSSARGARRAALDNLKVVLVACVIVGHVFITYGDIGSWAYSEPSTNDAFNIVAALVVALGSLFAMGLFFLIAGLLTPGPLARKGTAGFLRDRTVRLGVPSAGTTTPAPSATPSVGPPSGPTCCRPR